jgi:hypothetical protein
MESIKEQLRLLIEEGGKFTFNNFCFPHRHPREFGGEDSPEWLSWKTRSLNVISQVVSQSSPAFKLVMTGINIQTQGNHGS